MLGPELELCAAETCGAGGRCGLLPPRSPLQGVLDWGAFCITLCLSPRTLYLRLFLCGTREAVSGSGGDIGIGGRGLPKTRRVGCDPDVLRRLLLVSDIVQIIMYDIIKSTTNLLIENVSSYLK